MTTQITKSDFCKLAGYASGSASERSILSLTDDKFNQLEGSVDPANDCLIHVDDDGFSVNYGNVGSMGIRQGWD